MRPGSAARRTDSIMPGTSMTTDPHAPVLTLVIASRNDRHMGDSVWRLQTALNYTARSAAQAGRLHDVEILVTDWGSETPLRTVLRLSPAAAGIVSFLHVPPDEARRLQGDSPFPEVLALNAAVRRGRGTYIGRIDNDTLVHRRFLDQLLRLVDGDRTINGVPLDSALIFTNRRQIPYRFAERRPPFWQVDWFIRKYGPRLLVQSGEAFGQPFYYGATGILLLHRSLWMKATGYDESLLYWGWMEQDMIHRLRGEHGLVDWDRLYGCEFYHLEHYNPRVRRVTTRRGNTARATLVMRPNGPSWGLVDRELPRSCCAETDQLGVEMTPPRSPGPHMLRTLMSIRLRELMDAPYVCARRGREAVHALSSQPFRAWPRLLTRWLKMMVR